MINKASSDGEFHGFQLALAAPQLTHLFFADDALIFCQDSPQGIATLTGLLNTFTNASGQRINITKLGIIFGAATPNVLIEG